MRAESEAITAWNAMGGSPEVSHTEIVLALLQMSWLRVHLYAERLRAQVEADEGQPELGRTRDGDALGEPPPGVEDAGTGTSGLIGHTYSGVKDIGIFATGEAVRALVQLEAQERDRAVRFAKTAHDMGIADAMVDLARRWGAQAEQLLRFVLSGLGHDLGDPAVVALVERGLAELESGGESDG